MGPFWLFFLLVDSSSVEILRGKKIHGCRRLIRSDLSCHHRSGVLLPCSVTLLPQATPPLSSFLLQSQAQYPGANVPLAQGPRSLLQLPNVSSVLHASSGEQGGHWGSLA